MKLCLPFHSCISEVEQKKWFIYIKRSLQESTFSTQRAGELTRAAREREREPALTAAEPPPQQALCLPAPRLRSLAAPREGKRRQRALLGVPSATSRASALPPAVLHIGHHHHPSGPFLCWWQGESWHHKSQGNSVEWPSSVHLLRPPHQGGWTTSSPSALPALSY